MREIWSKLQYWQKGSVIGVLVGLLVVAYLYIFRSGDLLTSSNLNIFVGLHLTPLFVAAKVTSHSLNDKVWFLGAASILVWYAFFCYVGSVIFSLLSKKLKSNFLKTVIVAIILVLTVSILNFIAAVSIASGAN